MDDFEKRIGQYVQLRNKVRELKEEHKKQLKPYDDAMEVLESHLLSMLNQTKQKSARTSAGTAFIKVERSATIADASAFRRHVIGSEAWDLVDWRANKTKVTELVKETGEAPPGVNFSTMNIVQVRSPSNGE